jgi:hypothetical protein
MNRRRSALIAMSLLAGLLVSAPSASAAPTCAQGGQCKLGDTGPAGGVVFYAAPTPQWWGQYFEVMTSKMAVSGSWTSVIAHPGDAAVQERTLGKLLGFGTINTDRLVAISPQWRQMVGDKMASRNPNLPNETARTWSVPSKDELDALYTYITTSSSPLATAFATGLRGQPYWTSSEASDTFAWYQLFHDGTQFTDANGIVRGLTGNKDRTKSSKHKGSNFKPARMIFPFVRPFAPVGVFLPPAPPFPFIPAEGGRSSPSCAAGVSCQVGDIGPGGGLVFYDAGSRQSWGRYLEASPASCEGVGKVWRNAAPGQKGTGQLPLLYPTWATAARQRVQSKAIGMGKANTELIFLQHKKLPLPAIQATAAGYAFTLECGGQDDWFLPSKDELDTLYNVLKMNFHGLNWLNAFGFERGFYWTSSEYNNETAWTQYWVDGQQFDREKWLAGNQKLLANGLDPRPFRVRAIRAFG